MTSDSVGNYEVPDLAAGHYTITLSRDGFKTTTLPDVELQVAERASINPVLEVGADCLFVCNQHKQRYYITREDLSRIISTVAAQSTEGHANCLVLLVTAIAIQILQVGADRN